MDIQSILPLLMKNNNSDMEKITSLLSSKNGTEDVLKSLLGKDNPQASAILSMLKNNSATPKKRAMGLEPIKDIANDEIFGRITKFFIN